MSHAHATFIFSDRGPLFGEYNGTSDVMLPLMFSSREQVDDNWRKQEWKNCICKGEPISCIAHTDYGGGFWWYGKACLACKIFIGPQMPFEEDCVTYDREDLPGSYLIPFG